MVLDKINIDFESKEYLPEEKETFPLVNSYLYRKFYHFGLPPAAALNGYAIPLFACLSERHIIYIHTSDNPLYYISFTRRIQVCRQGARPYATRQINYYCTENRIPGAVKMVGVWLLPKTAVKP